MVLSLLASRRLVANSSSRQVACALLKHSNGTCLLRRAWGGREGTTHICKAQRLGECGRCA